MLKIHNEYIWMAVNVYLSHNFNQDGDTVQVWRSEK